MLLNVVLLIFNLRFLCMTSDYSSVVFSWVCRICVLVSFTLAHQDMLNTASEATGINWRGEGNNDMNNSTRNVMDIVSQVLSNGTNQTFNRWKPQNVFPEALSHSSFTDSSSPPDHDPFQLGYEAVYIGPEVLVDMEIPDEIVLAGSQPIHRKRPVKDGFSKDQEKILLDLHNLYRSNVTPSASNMNFMEWDEKLAVVAQQWANGCHFEHGFPPGYESIFPKSMGQNLYMGWDHLGERALYMWYEEYMYYDLETLYCVTNKQCGHYTQMTWGDSKLVGCGMKKCGVRQFYIVCHYHPAGNIVGSRPYVVGKPCSQCNTKDGGLCTNNLCVTKDQCTSNAANCTQQDIFKDLPNQIPNAEHYTRTEFQLKNNTLVNSKEDISAANTKSYGKLKAFNKSKFQDMFEKTLIQGMFNNISIAPGNHTFLRGNQSLYIDSDVLVDMKSEEMTLLDTQPFNQKITKVHSFSHDQKMTLLRLHKFYRGNVTPPAANMNFMEWDEELAIIAQLWADNCKYEHGFPPGHSYPNSMGQNLYMGWDSSGERALNIWYEEYKDYKFNKLQCSPRKQCGHYTQMAWSNSIFLGCGMKKCGEKKFFVVCHYSPAGNIIGKQPYIVGKACSQCFTGYGGYCDKNLCVTKDQCDRNPDCHAVCKLECQNCASLKRKTCTCDCFDGWDSLDCSKKCMDSDARCGKSRGWPNKESCSLNNNEVANVSCRKMCEKCRGVEGSGSIRKVCCNKKLCEEGKVLDTTANLCECHYLCPGPKCYDGFDSGESSEIPFAPLIFTSIQFFTSWFINDVLI